MKGIRAIVNFALWEVIYSFAKGITAQIPLVFAHTTIPGSCGPLPDFLKEALIQAIKSQTNSSTEIVLLSNFKQCRWALHDLQSSDDIFQTLKIAESMSIKSAKTQDFERKLKNVMPKIEDESMISASLYRFFMLEDYMKNNSLQYLMHFESDNMIYGDLSVVSERLKIAYKSLAATPSIHKRFISSAALWIGNFTALQNLNTFLLDLARNETGSFSRYVSWLRGFACCKSVEQGGVYPDALGKGIKAWAVSDMTMLAYYRHFYHSEVRFLPLLPRGNYRQEVGAGPLTTGSTAGTQNHHQKHHYVNMSLYSPGGAEVGVDFGEGIFDCGVGCWGSHFGNQQSNIATVAGLSVSSDAPSSGAGTAGTPSAAASGELEAASLATRHLVEQAVQRYNCTVQMKCVSVSSQPPAKAGKISPSLKGSVVAATATAAHTEHICVTRPCVSCGSGTVWTPLISMHVAKGRSTDALKSTECPCAFAVSFA